MAILPMRKRFKWKDCQQIINNIAGQIVKANVKYDCVISVNRGGLIIGTALSYLFNIPHGVISVQYKEKFGRAVDTELSPELQMNIDDHISINANLMKMKKVLLFDDSCDTGYLMTHTVNFVKSKLLNIDKLDVAVIVLHKQSDYIPTYYYEKMNGTQLFGFDWEQY